MQTFCIHSKLRDVVNELSSVMDGYFDAGPDGHIYLYHVEADVTISFVTIALKYIGVVPTTRRSTLFKDYSIRWYVHCTYDQSEQDLHRHLYEHTLKSVLHNKLSGGTGWMAGRAAKQHD